MAEKIIVKTLINAPVQKVWDYYNKPEHLVKWNQASEDWHTVSAHSDLRVGGEFGSRMEAKDGSAGFDFGGVYDAVDLNKLIQYTMSDGRSVKINFEGDTEQTNVTVEFDAETENTLELQQEGWQAILDSFKNYTENN